MSGFTIPAFLAVAGAGAALRWLAADRWPGGHRGTLLVNVLGAFLLGLLAGSDASAATLTVVGTGGLGALTTFSRLAQDAVDLAESSDDTSAGMRSPGVPVLYLGTTLVLGLAAAWLGLEITA
jgi:CrcB protein|tara:strand:+ start:621 stop:989 length:369 start_codon:yes stop_codon:yes gene_type:complete